MNNETEDQSADSTKRSKPRRKRGGLFIAIIFISGIILLSRQQPLNTIDCNADIIAGKPDIVMLGAWWCTYCYKAKKYFQKNNINYCEYDMENTREGQRLYEQHGGGAVPVLLIGNYTLRGFDEQQIEAALDTLKNN